MKKMFICFMLMFSVSLSWSSETDHVPNFSYFPDLRNCNSFRAYYTMLCYMDKSLGPLTFVPYNSARFKDIKDELDYLIFYDYFINKSGRLIKRQFSDLPRSGGDEVFENFRKSLKDDSFAKLTD